MLAKGGDVWTPTGHHTALKAAWTSLACFNVTQICIHPLSEALRPASSVERLADDVLIRLHKLRQLTVKLLVLCRQRVAKVVQCHFLLGKTGAASFTLGLQLPEIL